MSFVRKRTVTLDGVDVIVAPLTCAQAEQFIAANNECVRNPDGTRKADADVDNAALVKIFYQMVVDGLNNAQPELKMTIERFKAEFDQGMFKALNKTILEMSELNNPEGEKATT